MPEMLKLTVKDFKSDQEVRWCPGCGDYAILAAVQSFMPELNIPRERIVFVSGIGCSSRFPYYMNTYGMHSIHGRAPAIATGLSVSRPDLSVWVVTGDGDALGADATFVARTLDSDRKHLQSVLRAAADHNGSAFVEIYQNCNIFNDGAFETLKDPATRDDYLIRLEHGQPITFGADRQWCVVHPPGAFGLKVRRTAETPADHILVHDAAVPEPAYAFALSRLPDLDLRHTPIGVLRSVERPSYDELVRSQVSAAEATLTRSPQEELASLLNSGDTWTIV